MCKFRADHGVNESLAADSIKHPYVTHAFGIEVKSEETELTRPAADPFKTGMGTRVTSVLLAYIFILYFEPRLMNVLYGIPTLRELMS